MGEISYATLAARARLHQYHYGSYGSEWVKAAIAFHEKRNFTDRMIDIFITCCNFVSVASCFLAIVDA